MYETLTKIDDIIVSVSPTTSDKKARIPIEVYIKVQDASDAERCANAFLDKIAMGEKAEDLLLQLGQYLKDIEPLKESENGPEMKALETICSRLRTEGVTDKEAQNA